MNNYEDRANLPNQGILYHYTSLAGLKGIVDNGKIWATNILYLNDSEEFFNAMEAVNFVFEVIWDTEITDALNEDEQDFLSSLEKRIKDIFEYDVDGFKVFVSSFSENADTLSQWRGYCPSGSGVCIGFDFDMLNKLTGCELVKCIYVKQSTNSDEEQDGFNQVYTFINGYLKVFQSFEHNENKEENTENLLQDFEREFLKFAARVKHPGFKEENEWRLIISLNETTNEKVLYRSGKSMLVPYIEVNVRDGNGTLNMPDLWLGPAPHPDLSRNSIVDFLNAQKVYAYRYQLEDATDPDPYPFFYKYEQKYVNNPVPFLDAKDKYLMEKVAPNVWTSEIPYRDW